MFEMEFHLEDSNVIPRSNKTGLTWNRSHINVVAHKAVCWDFLFTDDSWILLIYDLSSYSGEGPISQKTLQRSDSKKNTNTTHQEIEDIKENITRTFEHSYIIEGVVGDVTGGISVQAGLAPSLPVYFENHESTLYISWDVEKLLSRAPRVPNFLVLAHRLALQTPYSVDTIFEGVQLLTERSSIIYSPNGLNFHYPNQLAYEPSLEFGSPEVEFFKRLHSYFDHTSRIGLRSATEISGGIDSAMTAYFSSVHKNDNFSLGLLIGGKLGIQQASRRNKLVKAFDFKDHSIDIENFPPLLPILEGEEIRYRDEFYLRGFKSLWSAAKSQGYDSITSGQGGDELFYTQRERLGSSTKAIRPLPEFLSKRASLAASIDSIFFAPPGLMANTVYNGFGVQTRELTRLGLWPLQPFTMPSIVAPCKKLKNGSKLKKQILKDFLQKKLSFDLFPDNYNKENFTLPMMRYILKHESKIRRECRELALYELGLVNADALSTLLDDFFEKNNPFVMDQLVFLLSIEGVIREYGHV